MANKKYSANALNKNSLDKNAGNNGGENKALTRYLFICMGMILYIIPSISCFWVGLSGEGMSMPLIMACVTELLSFPIGFMGILAVNNKKLRIPAIIVAVVTILCHIYTFTITGVSYLILAPSVILVILFIPFSAVVNTDLGNKKPY